MILTKAALLCGATALCVACGRPEVPDDPIVTSISGRVLDAETSDPIGAALVQTEPFVKQAFTTAEGLYTIESGLTVGTTYRVTATKAGYVDNSVSIANVVEGENTVADILLSPEGPELSLSTTTVQINGGSNAGTFRVGNSGDQTQALSFSVTSPESWVTDLNPSSGNVTSVEQTITVSIDRSLLPAGTGNVSGLVEVTSNGGSATVALSVVR